MKLVLFPLGVPFTCLHGTTLLLGIHLDALFQESCCAISAQSLPFVCVFSTSWQLFIFLFKRNIFNYLDVDKISVLHMHRISLEIIFV